MALVVAVLHRARQSEVLCSAGAGAIRIVELTRAYVSGNLRTLLLQIEVGLAHVAIGRWVLSHPVAGYVGCKAGHSAHQPPPERTRYFHQITVPPKRRTILEHELWNMVLYNVAL